MKLIEKMTLAVFLVVSLFGCGGGGSGDEPEEVLAALSTDAARPFERVTVTIGRAVEDDDSYTVFVDGEPTIAVGPKDSIGFLAPMSIGQHTVALEFNNSRSDDLALVVVEYETTPVPQDIVLGGLAVLDAATNQMLEDRDAAGDYPLEVSIALADMQVGLVQLGDLVDDRIGSLNAEEYELFIQMLDTHGVLGILQELELSGGVGTSAVAAASVYSSLHAGAAHDARNLIALTGDVLSFALGNLREGLKIGVIASAISAPFTAGGSVAPAIALQVLRTKVKYASLLIDGFMPTDLVFVARTDDALVDLGTGRQVALGFEGTFESEMTAEETVIALAVMSLEIKVYEEYMTPDGDTYEITLQYIQDIVNEVAAELSTFGLNSLASTLGDALDNGLFPITIPLDPSLYQLDLDALLELISSGTPAAMQVLLDNLHLDLPTLGGGVEVEDPQVASYNVSTEMLRGLSPGETIVTPKFFRFEERTTAFGLIHYYWPYVLTVGNGKAESYAVTVTSVYEYTDDFSTNTTENYEVSILPYSGSQGNSAAIEYDAASEHMEVRLNGGYGLSVTTVRDNATVAANQDFFFSVELSVENEFLTGVYFGDLMDLGTGSSSTYLLASLDTYGDVTYVRGYVNGVLTEQSSSTPQAGPGGTLDMLREGSKISFFFDSVLIFETSNVNFSSRPLKYGAANGISSGPIGYTSLTTFDNWNFQTSP